MSNPNSKDLIVGRYVVDQEHMLGAFEVKSEKTGLTFFIDPASPGPFVLYFDNDLFCWMLDTADNLKWDNNTERWISR